MRTLIDVYNLPLDILSSQYTLQSKQHMYIHISALDDFRLNAAIVGDIFAIYSGVYFK